MRPPGCSGLLRIARGSLLPSAARSSIEAARSEIRDLRLPEAVTLPLTMDRVRLLARQHLETIRLLGVDFVPIAAAPPALAAITGQDQPSPPPAAPPAAEPGLFGGPAGQPQLPLGQGAEGPPELPPDRKPDALEALRARHDAECPHCTTATAHTRTVFGEGDPDADLMFIGEAPGEEEDRTGRPFVGRAGRKLEEILEAMTMQRQQVYIANILKSRPPGNRTPLPGEVEGCALFLAEQIRIIRWWLARCIAAWHVKQLSQQQRRTRRHYER